MATYDHARVPPDRFEALGCTALICWLSALRANVRHGRAPVDREVLGVKLGGDGGGDILGCAGALLRVAPAEGLGVVVRADQARSHRGLVDRLLKALRQRRARSSAITL